MQIVGRRCWYNGGDWGKWALVYLGAFGNMGVEIMGVGVGSGTHFPIEHLGQWGFPEVGVQLELHMDFRWETFTVVDV